MLNFFPVKSEQVNEKQNNKEIQTKNNLVVKPPQSI